MSVFVYFCDDYDELGGIGLEEFGNDQDAIAFIKERLGKVGDRNKGTDLNCYQVFRGCRVKLEPIEIIKGVRFLSGS